MADNKNVSVSKTLKQDVRDYVWKHRLSGMGNVVQQIIIDYAEGRVQPVPKTVILLDDEIKYVAPPEYEVARLKARAEGTTLSDVIRAELVRRVEPQE